MKKKSTLTKKMLFIGTFMLFLSSTMFTFRAKAQSFVQEFNNFSALFSNGWDTINHGSTHGSSTWFQGSGGTFPAYSGIDANSYAGANFNSITGIGTISSWLITPQVTLFNNDVIEFYTRKNYDSSFNYADRMQVRLSTNGASAYVGTTPLDTGDFTTLLLDINPTLDTNNYPIGYPWTWTRFTLTISGLSGPTPGRFAFRYFVPNGGPSSTRNSDYIGVDSVAYVSILTGIQHAEPKINVSLFPNPGNGIFNMEFNSEQSLQATLEVVNELGQVVYNEKMNVYAGKNNHSMDLGILPGGVYFVKLKTSYELFNQKLIIQN